MSDLDQSFFQVRFDWGLPGLRRLAAADVVVIVDVLPDSDEYPDASPRPSTRELAAFAADSGALVLAGDLRHAAATARAVLDLQHRRGAWVSVAVIAVGELEPAPDTDPDTAPVPAVAPGPRPTSAPAEPRPLRITVEDQLGAGAVIAALGDVGLDHTSPDAAVAAEAFRGLRRAVRHMLLASGSGKRLVAAGARGRVIAAAEIDAEAEASVLTSPR